MYRIHALALVVMAAVFVTLACSGGQGNPTSNPVAQMGNSQTSIASSSHLWGLWDVSLNPETMQADIVPLRGPAFSANVTQFMQPPASAQSRMSIKLDSSSDFPNGYVVVDVSFTHPFSGLNTYTGFDVRGVCIGNGSISGIHDPGIKYGGASDLRVLNADGLTRWFNPSEFTKYGTLFGYTRGKMGAPSDAWTGTLNGYKYFCDDLLSDYPVNQFFLSPACANPRGYFAAGSTLTRRYELQFPGPQFKFQYGVIANWESPTVNPPVNIPGDFTLSANCPEAYAVSTTDKSDMYFVDNTVKGGHLKLLVTVMDHQGALNPSGVAGEISAIRLETPNSLITGQLASFDIAALNAAVQSQDEKSVTYLLQVNNVAPSASGDFPVLVAVESMNPNTYDSGFPGFAYPTGALAAYFNATVNVSDQNPSTPPVAAVDTITESPFYKGDTIEFDASGSYDPDGGSIVLYEWDWDNDGTFDETGGPTASHKWPVVGTYYIQLRVTDDEGSTGILDTPFEVDIHPIPKPHLVAELTGLHSPYCTRIDYKNNDAWVDCTEAAPVLDFGFYRIDNSENMTKDHQKNGSGFFGMPGPFTISTEARQILAPSMLAIGPLLVDMWDLDSGTDKQFNLPMDGPTGIFFCGDSDLFADIKTAVLSDPIADRLLFWDYTLSSPTYTIKMPITEFPNTLEADYEGHRLFAFCRNTGGSSGTCVMEVWNVETKTKTTQFNTVTTVYPLMSDMDYDPGMNRLYFGSNDVGNFEIWDTESYTLVQNVMTVGGGGVAGIDHMGGAFYVTKPNHLFVYDIDTLALLWDVTVGPEPKTVACNPKTHKIYFADMTNNVEDVYAL